MQVIFNADDFGASAEINQAILQAHRQGVLTSASLMVTGEAVLQAVEIARQNPTLAVGLHLVLISGWACLAPERIPHLVDRRGNFADDPLKAGVTYFCSAIARRELSEEIAAQFEYFSATGLPLDHVNGHLHMHLHPAVFGPVLQQAVAHGASGLRLPRDELKESLAYNRQQATVKILWALEFAALNRWALSRLTGIPVVVTHRVYGFLQSGQMTEAYVARMLNKLSVGTAEFYFHPSHASQTIPLGPSRGDFETLISPGIKQIITQRNLHLSSYTSLKKVQVGL